jgi:hypothetical protein
VAVVAFKLHEIVVFVIRHQTSSCHYARLVIKSTSAPTLPAMTCSRICWEQAVHKAKHSGEYRPTM